MNLSTPPPGGAAPAQPYDDLRVLDVTHRFGSYAGRLFADLGAEVLRLEPAGGLPDRTRDPESDFTFLNAGKKSVVVDFADLGKSSVLAALVRGAAVVLLERDAPLVDRIDALRALNSRLVVTVISPWGLDGPRAAEPASDLTLQAAGGIAWMSGRIDREPLALPFRQATMVASIYAATATAIALRDAEATGRGHLVDVSVQECIAHSLQNALQVWDLEERVSMRGGEGTRDATEDIFPCRDGFVFLASPLSLGTSWKSLVGWMRELGHPSGEILSEAHWSDREWRLGSEARIAFREAFVAFTRQFTRDEMTAGAIRRRVVLGPVNTIDDAFGDPQLRWRDFFTTIDTEGREIAFPGAPYRLTPPVWRTAPAPRLGAHAALTEALP